VRDLIQIVVVNCTTENLGCHRVWRHPVSTTDIDKFSAARGSVFDKLPRIVKGLLASGNEVLHGCRFQGNRIRFINLPDNCLLTIQANRSKFHAVLLTLVTCMRAFCRLSILTLWAR
jgi:hypothetical protein